MIHRMLVGLGNPGREYEGHRHNAGFMMVDQAAAAWGCAMGAQGKFKAILGKVVREDICWLLVKPQTFMNASGEAVQRIAAYFKVLVEDQLVVYDDLDLPLGAIRMKPGGSSGGHNGIKSIESLLGTSQFPRLRLGIGREAGDRQATVRYVLSDFSGKERERFCRALQRALDQVEEWQRSSFEKAMSLYNGRILEDDSA